jgi:hypothetical protein
MNRRLEKIKQDSASANEAIAELVASGELTAHDGQKPSTSIELPNSIGKAYNTETETIEKTVASETSSANEIQEPQDAMVSESKYKSAVKAMNAAQKERSEYEKTLKDILEQNESIKRELEDIRNQKVSNVDTDNLSELFNMDTTNDEVSDWEAEFPKTARIAEKKALVVKNELNNKFKTVEDQVNTIKAELDESKIRKQINERDEQIKQVHPDFDDVRLSDEFKEWIYGSAPSIYRGVYEGTIPFDVNDVIKVFDDYKLSTNKTTVPTTVKKVAPAEMRVKTSPSVSSNMRLENVEELTEVDFMRISQNIHRVKDPVKRAELMKKADNFFSKQFKT